MGIILLIIGGLLALGGIIGAIVPGIPGPILGYLSLIVLNFSGTDHPFGIKFFIVTGLIVVIVSALDYILPIMGAKVYGSSKYGIWGSFIGLAVCFFVFPPFGPIIGIFLGAVIGEFIAGKERNEAIKAGIATIIGNALSTSAQLILSIVFLLFYFLNL